MSDSVESLLRKTGVEFEVPGFDDSGSQEMVLSTTAFVDYVQLYRMVIRE